MEEKVYYIYQSNLEIAKDTNDTKWLLETFAKASNKIKDGGSVHILQRLSDASTELVAIIDTLDMLDNYREKYSA